MTKVTAATETIGRRIERLAAERGKTMAELREALGVSYETTRKWSTGDTAPNRNRTAQLAKLLGVSEDVITYGEVREAPEPSPRLARNDRELELLVLYRVLERRIPSKADLSKLTELLTELAQMRPERLHGAIAGAHGGAIAGSHSPSVKSSAAKVADAEKPSPARPHSPQTEPKRARASTSRRTG
jgi:transcriptional regulator with XRE-family HTH domain